MKKKWIINNNQENCILFFNGWGADENSIKNLKPESNDICMYYDYSFLETDFSEFKRYAKLYLISWSLGVYISSILFDNVKLSFEKAIAINGTLNPIDDFEGINRQIFTKTLETWNTENCERFNKRIYGKLFQKLTDTFSVRSIDNRKAELDYIFNLYKTNQFSKFEWDKAIVSSNDMIFLPQNQLFFWNKTETVVQKIESVHFPFSNFSSWNEIIEI